MFDIRIDRPTEMELTHKDDSIQALRFDRQDEAFSVRRLPYPTALRSHDSNNLALQL